MIRAVVFDVDNTLLDFMTVKRHAVEAAAEAMGDAGFDIPKAEMVKKIYEHYEREGLEDQQIFDKVLTTELGKIDYKILAAGIIAYRRAKEGHLALYPHVVLTLTRLVKMGLRMAVVSDAPRLPVWMRITSLGLQHFFDTVVAYEDTGHKKPASLPFLKALDFMGVKPAEALMIGDWAERDVAGAKSLGMKTVLARYGNEKKVENSGADYEIDDIMDLLEIVRGENAKP